MSVGSTRREQKTTKKNKKKEKGRADAMREGGGGRRVRAITSEQPDEEKKRETPNPISELLRLVFMFLQPVPLLLSPTRALSPEDPRSFGCEKGANFTSRLFLAHYTTTGGTGISPALPRINVFHLSFSTIAS
jgi:hypothetical protein